MIQIWNEDILAVIIGAGGGIGLCMLISYFIYRARTQGREFTHKERMALLEKAQNIPENIEELLMAITAGPENDLRSGLIWSIIGVGLTLMLYLLEDSRPYWPSGLIVIFVGLAYFVSFALISRRRQLAREQNMSALVIKTTSVQALTEDAQPVALPAQETSTEEEAKT
jgi:hypothetical protein